MIVLDYVSINAFIYMYIYVYGQVKTWSSNYSDPVDVNVSNLRDVAEHSVHSPTTAAVTMCFQTLCWLH